MKDRQSEMERKPRILIPYVPHENANGDYQDFFIILRPEANGVEVESLLLKVVTGNPEYKADVSFVYLANIPGDFIIRNRIVEQHYHLKISFARKGPKIFTPYMKKCFQEHFGVPADESEIIGAFQALTELNCSEEDLFNIRVPREDMMEINGQTIKKIDGRYIINYDIPAILHKNSHKTDMAVMVFRSKLNEDGFKIMIKRMGENLVEHGILGPHRPISRIFHYSKSPLEFLLDSSGYLLKDTENRFPLGQLDFVRYLHERDIPMRFIEGVLKYPLMTFRNSAGGLVERDIFKYTMGSSFKTSYQKLISALGQCYIA